MTVAPIHKALKAFEVVIPRCHIVKVLNGEHDKFRHEIIEVLQTALSKAGWITVDDTGARHRPRNADACCCTIPHTISMPL